MRNYIETFWIGVIFTNGTGFDHEDFLAGDEDELAQKIDDYLATQLPIVPPPDDWRVFQYYNEPEGDQVFDDWNVSHYFLELNKANLIDLMSSVSSGLTFYSRFHDLFVEESPRKTWAHGH